MNERGRIVVVGGGITGALSAWELVRAGFEVVVLEARERGAGSSSRSAACIRQQFSTEATVRAMIRSVAAYARFAEDFRCAPGAGDVLVQNGYLFLHARDGVGAGEAWDGALRRVAMQRRAGLDDVEVLEPGEVGARFPQVDPSGLLGATFCKSDGFLRADLIYQEALRRVEELGGVVRPWSPVVGGLFDGAGTLCGVRLGDGEELPAQVVVNATNAWAPRLSTLLGGVDLPIAPTKRYLYFLERGESVDAAALLQWPMTITPGRAYCRPENGQQLLLGWSHDAPPEPGFGWEDQDHVEAAFSHRTGIDNHGVRTWLELAAWVPGVAEFAGLVATTCGYYAMTRDHNPYFGFDPQQPRLLHAAGFSGHGAMLGPFSARVVRAMVEAGRTIDHLLWDGATIDLRDLLLGRGARDAEGMVI